MKRSGPHWSPTGWRIVSPRGVIRFSCPLPGGAEGEVLRDRPGKPWCYKIGADGAVHGRYKTELAAMKACDIALMAALKSGQAILRKVRRQSLRRGLRKNFYPIKPNKIAPRTC